MAMSSPSVGVWPLCARRRKSAGPRKSTPKKAMRQGKMKLLMIIHRNSDRAAEEVAAQLEPVATYARKLYADETERVVYSRADGNCSVLILEVQNEAQAKAIAEELPVIKAGLMRYEIYGLK